MISDELSHHVRRSALISSDTQVLRYTPVARAFYRATVALVLAVPPLASVVEPSPKVAEKSMVFAVHRSVWLTILLLIAPRLVWRARHPATSEQDGAGRLKQCASPFQRHSAR